MIRNFAKTHLLTVEDTTTVLGKWNYTGKYVLGLDLAGRRFTTYEDDMFLGPTEIGQHVVSFPSCESAISKSECRVCQYQQAGS